MSYVPVTTGATVAVAAAAAARRRMMEEEEKLTTYKSDDLDGWEFKIVRSNEAYFKKPEKMRKVIEEEARYGWEFLEKFDNQRIRFKRRAKRSSSAMMGQSDEYRTQVGINAGALVALILGITFGAAALIFGLVVLFIGFD